MSDCVTALGLSGYGCTGTLTINAISLNCPAWDITDLTSLWAEVAQRGEDRRIPGVAGVIAYRRRNDVTEHSLAMVISGDVDSTGAPYANPWVGLETNIAALRTNVVDPTNLTDGTRPAILTMPSGATRTANVHVLGLRLSEAQGVDGVHAYAFAALTVSIPLGAFV